MSRILWLALLAPDLVEAILGGWGDQGLMLERLEAMRGSSASGARTTMRYPEPLLDQRTK